MASRQRKAYMLYYARTHTQVQTATDKAKTNRVQANRWLQYTTSKGKGKRR